MVAADVPRVWLPHRPDVAGEMTRTVTARRHGDAWRPHLVAASGDVSPPIADSYHPVLSLPFVSRERAEAEARLQGYEVKSRNLKP